MLNRSVCHRRALAINTLLAACLLPETKMAQAATESSTMAVTATVVATCVVAALPLAFGNYAMAQTDGTTSVTAVCTSGTAYTLSASVGTGDGATVATRKLTGPSGATLDYSLFQNAGRSTVWGQTIGTDTFAFIVSDENDASLAKGFENLRNGSEGH